MEWGEASTSGALIYGVDGAAVGVAERTLCGSLLLTSVP